MEQGAYTNAGGKVARAIQTDHLELEVALKRSDAAWVNIGDPVNIESKKRDLSWKGKVIRKGQFVEESTQSQTIFIQISYDRKQPLLAGEYLVAHFPVRPIDNAMEIPRNSVLNTDEVFVVREGRLAKEKIDIIKINDRTMIFNGIAEGDTLVVQQLINVSEGTLVQTDKSASAKPGSGPGAPSQDPGSSAEGKKAKRK